MQAACVARRLGMGVHVRVDPDQPERAASLLVQHARDAAPGAAGAAVVAADDARQAALPQRIGHRRGEQAAQAAYREELAALVRPGGKDRPAQRRVAAIAQARLGERRERRRGGAAARVRAP